LKDAEAAIQKMILDEVGVDPAAVAKAAGAQVSSALSDLTKMGRLLQLTTKHDAYIYLWTVPGDNTASWLCAQSEKDIVGDF
jgi:predicted  nucleic acid-binding Zn ribbon protein